MSDAPLCRDCHFLRDGDRAPRFWKCYRTQLHLAGHLLDGGEPQTMNEYCDMTRLDSRQCGAEGKWFVKRVDPVIVYHARWKARAPLIVLVLLAIASVLIYIGAHHG